jgi:ABC-type transport system substrate-binding protein
MEDRSYWKGTLGRRYSRRRALALAGAAAGAAAILAACGGDGDGGGAGSGAKSGDLKPRRGGTITLSLGAQLATLHPQGTGAGDGLIRDYVNDRLFNYDYQNSTYELSLAASLEQPDAAQVVFKMSPQAKYQQLAPANGRNVTAQDVVASWTYYKDNPRTIGAKTIWTQETERLETPDTTTVRVVLKRPTSWAIGPHGLAGPYPSLVTLPELHAGEALEKTAVGAGAYHVERFDPTTGASFIRRPDGWRGERPYADRMVFMVITDETARAAAFRAKQIDSLLARDKLQAEEFQSFGQDMVIVKEFGFPRMMWLRSDKPPFSDIRVREAVYNALDIKELIDRVDLGEGVYTGPIPAHLAALSLPENELKAQFPANKQKAQDLLRAASFDTNREFEFKIPNDPKSVLLAEVLQKQFAAVSIKTKIIPQDPNTVFAQTITSSDIEIAAAGIRTRGQDGNVWVGGLSEGVNTSGIPTKWDDQAINTLVIQERGEVDAAKLKAIFLQIQREAFKKFAPTINLFTPYNFLARWSYYHPVRDRGYVGLLAHHQWTEKSS